MSSPVSRRCRTPGYTSCCPGTGRPRGTRPRSHRPALTSRCLSQPAGHPRERPSRPAVLTGGIRRCSCSFCIFASRADLRRAAELRPDLHRRYAELEQRIGPHPFAHTPAASGIDRHSGRTRRRDTRHRSPRLSRGRRPPVRRTVARHRSRPSRILPAHLSAARVGDTATTPCRRESESGLSGPRPRGAVESPSASGRSVHTGDTDAHLRERRSLRFLPDTRRVGSVQQLPAPGRPDRRRAVDASDVRALVSGGEVRNAPGYPATRRRRADGEERGGRRPHTWPRHRPRLDAALAACPYLARRLHQWYTLCRRPRSTAQHGRPTCPKSISECPTNAWSSSTVPPRSAA